MAKVTITLDEEQVTRLEQVTIDRDGDGALKLLREIRRRVLESQARCDPTRLRSSTAIETITDRMKG